MLKMYLAIWNHTARRQVLLIILSVLLALLSAAPLEIQKDMINHMVGETDFDALWWLAGAFLGVMALSSGLKLAVQYASAALGEDVIRVIRNRIYQRLVESRGSSDEGPGTGTSVTMISSEAEQIGVFAGDSFTLPLLQLGTLLTVVVYISAQSLILGLITAAVVIPQGLLTIFTQGWINSRVRERVANLREGTDRIAQSDLSRVEPEPGECFDRIYEARCGIFRIKLSTKFLMNLLNGAGMSAILLIGGYFVMQGRTDVGTVTVALTGLAKAVQPWRELLMFYRRASMVRVRYEVLISTFPQAIEPEAAEARPA